MKPLRTAVTWMARSPVRAFIIIFLLGKRSGRKKTTLVEIKRL